MPNFLVHGTVEVIIYVHRNRITSETREPRSLEH